ncbi:chondroitin AC/alginate lyase [Lentinula raphanica]|uniref:Chondroitin AC/alginate lyase n=1 Tax=Lentinula raphanica TaxID=153919 RepID=A0AA38P5V5_9AGAR|nr:chondroitin AC/alginate lyase [Lentinula raphanica]
MPSHSVLCLLLAITIQEAIADPTDFVHPDYVLQHVHDASTNSAKASITLNAQSATKKGPYSIVNHNGVTAPSGDKHDYLSWAPYHWPDCNWCSTGRTHLVHSGDGGNGTDSNDPAPDEDLGPGEDSGDDDEYDDASYMQARSLHDEQLLELASRHNRLIRLRRRSLDSQNESPSGSSVFPTSTTGVPSAAESVLDLVPQVPQAPLGSLPSLPTSDLMTGSLPTATSHSTGQHFAGSSTAPQAAVKTNQPSKSACTPSPTKSLAPSATWTTCPYVARDGQVNPDVRTLAGAAAIDKTSDGFLSNVLASVFSGNHQYVKAAINILNAFFLDPETKMNPNVNFGQVVRGPGDSIGTFTGPLDMRGLVKVVNAILILKRSNTSEWTSDLDQNMQNWMAQYLHWLQNSAIGKKASSRPNNHGTFYYLAVSALSIALNKPQDATNALDEFFKNAFQEQIAKSGEQPFESIRTRPLHYRCFNLEGLIALAKIGDYLGKDYWDTKTKYGATIKTAVDFTMKVKPGNENVEELTPHVAAVAAAYGSSPAYDNFLTEQNAERHPFWFYDQPSALSHAPTSKSKASKRSMVSWRRDDDDGITGTVSPECPLIFQSHKQVEIDDGIFVTCEQILPFYSIDPPVD